MGVVASGKEVGAGQAHKGERAPVRSAADRRFQGGDARFGKGFPGVFHKMKMLFDFFKAVVILIPDPDFCGVFAVLFL